MDRPAFDTDTPDSPRDHEQDEMLQLVDEWVRLFEGDRSQTTARPPAEQRARSIARARMDWTRRGIRTDTGDAETHEQAVPPKSDPLPMRLDGLLATFTDPIGGSISLANVDGRLLHRGTVALRGRLSPLEAVCRDIGLPDHVCRAFEFVAAWYGTPFDAINLRSTADRILTWGFWGFTGEQLVACLDEWKNRAPESFASYCGAFGLDVLGADGDRANGERGQAVLTVRSEGCVSHGRSAEWAIASEPGLAAALARAGRDTTAQTAQVEVAIANSVNPIMFQPWDASGDETRSTLDVLTSPRSIAALLYLVRRHGSQAALRLLQNVKAHSPSQITDDTWLNELVRVLRRLRREHDAGEILRLSSSPELSAV